MNEFEFIKFVNDAIGSRAVQAIVEISSERQVRFLLNQLMPQIFLAATGKYSSFILQMILRAIVHISKEEPEYVASSNDEGANLKDGIPTMRALLHTMCKNLDPVWLKLATNKNGTHILRTLLVTLNNINENTLFESLVQVLLKALNMSRWLTDKVSGPILVLLIEIITSTSPLFSSLVAKVLNVANMEKLQVDSEQLKQRIHEFSNHEVSSHVIEAIVKSAPTNMFDSLYSFGFRNQLCGMSTSRYANFIAANVIEKATHKEQFELMFNELLLGGKFEEEEGEEKEKFMEVIWKTNTKNIICKIAEMCLKYDTKQKEFLKVKL